MRLYLWLIYDAQISDTPLRWYWSALIRYTRDYRGGAVGFSRN